MMNILSKGRKTVVGAVVLAIVTQAGVAAALQCKRAWPGFYNCASGALSANGNALNTSGPSTNRQVSIALQAGAYAQGGALDANANPISACSTARDTRASDGRFVIKDCFTQTPPSQILIVVL